MKQVMTRILLMVGFLMILTSPSSAEQDFRPPFDQVEHDVETVLSSDDHQFPRTVLFYLRCVGDELLASQTMLLNRILRAARAGHENPAWLKAMSHFCFGKAFFPGDLPSRCGPNGSIPIENAPHLLASEAAWFGEKALRLDPTDWSFYLHQSSCLEDARRLDDAIAVLRQAIQGGATEAFVPLVLAGLYEKKGLVHEAEPWVEKALGINPDRFLARVFRGRIHHRLGRFSDAIRQYRLAQQNLDARDSIWVTDWIPMALEAAEAGNPPPPEPAYRMVFPGPWMGRILDLERATGTQLILADRAAGMIALTPDAVSCPFPAALSQIASQAYLDCSWEGPIYLVSEKGTIVGTPDLEPLSDDEVGQAVSLCADRWPLARISDELAHMANVAVNIQPGVDGLLSCRLAGVSWRSAIMGVARSVGCVVRWEPGSCTIERPVMP